MAHLTVSNQRKPQQYVNALLFDGGGVRGLASLLILKELMKRLNEILGKQERRNDRLEPRDVFDLVAGTSTGGLIAIMLGKMGMTIRECIYAYRSLASDVFGTKSKLGGLSHGLLKARYEGAVLRRNVVKLLQYNDLKEGLNMRREENDPEDAIPCAVVCNEHRSKRRFKDFTEAPMHFCSTECTEQRGIPCQVQDAAQATTAAITYFEYVLIGSRRFSDGGLKYNNPSQTIWNHYTEFARAEMTIRHFRRASTSTVRAARHEGLHFGESKPVRIVNIGTGFRTQATPKRPKRQRLRGALTPDWLREIKGLGDTLKDRAVQTEEVAHTMEMISRRWPTDLEYHQLCPHNELCWIKLDAHKKLAEIEQYTQSWLEEKEVQDKITQIVEAIATEKFGWSRGQSSQSEAERQIPQREAQGPSSPQEQPLLQEQQLPQEQSSLQKQPMPREQPTPQEKRSPQQPLSLGLLQEQLPQPLLPAPRTLVTEPVPQSDQKIEQTHSDLSAITSHQAEATNTGPNTQVSHALSHQPQLVEMSPSPKEAAMPPDPSSAENDTGSSRSATEQFKGPVYTTEASFQENTLTEPSCQQINDDQNLCSPASLTSPVSPITPRTPSSSWGYWHLWRKSRFAQIDSGDASITENLERKNIESEKLASSDAVRNDALRANENFSSINEKVHSYTNSVLSHNSS